MRLSINKDSPFYDKEKLNAHPLVLLNGEPLKGCLEASEEEGWADVWKRDEAGKILLNEAKDAALIERVYGRIEITSEAA